MRVLHLSETSLSGSPYRISSTYNKYSGHEARHISWTDKVAWRDFQTDMVGETMAPGALEDWLAWADVLHFHNLWKRQSIFKHLPMPKKPSVIQIHSPRDSDDWRPELDSKLPIITLAQYHRRQWPEAIAAVPNMFDIHDPLYKAAPATRRERPLVSYAPSNCNGTGWNNKSYRSVGLTLKKMALRHDINYDLIFGVPHLECLDRKRIADIGVDEVSTGSYHLSSLEYMAMGIPCICRLDALTEKAVREVTGCEGPLPWIQATDTSFRVVLPQLLKHGDMRELGWGAKAWMDRYWDPRALCQHYTRVYENLV